VLHFIGFGLELTRGKFAFCEGVLNVTSFVEIEHYHAKTLGKDILWAKNSSRMHVQE